MIMTLIILAAIFLVACFVFLFYAMTEKGLESVIPLYIFVVFFLIALGCGISALIINSNNFVHRCETQGGYVPNVRGEICLKPGTVIHVK